LLEIKKEGLWEERIDLRFSIPPCVLNGNIARRRRGRRSRRRRRRHICTNVQLICSSL
jgi:hypothetical protein